MTTLSSLTAHVCSSPKATRPHVLMVAEFLTADKGIFLTTYYFLTVLKHQ